MIRVNGNDIKCEEKTISEFLKEKGYRVERVAVELNGKIVPRSEFENISFKDGDRVEIVGFVGGG